MDELTPTWTAHWIKSPVVGGPRSVPPVPCFRTCFELPSAVDRATLHITALGLYTAVLNGKRVGTDVFAPGWTDYHKRVSFQNHDATPYLTEGENALGVMLGDGWYCGHVGPLHRQVYGERPELLAQLEITLSNGKSMTLGTDAEWKTSTGPILEADFMMGEHYDARREIAGWAEPGFDDAEWDRVLVSDAKTLSVERSLGQPVRAHEVLRGREMRDVQPVWKAKREIIFDFGQNLVGRIRLKVSAPSGTHLTIRHAERLNPDGTLYTANYRSARCICEYTCKGEGTEVWEPEFFFTGFQYAEVSGVPKDASIEVEGVVLHSEMERTGHFECSHALLNQLYQNIVWGQKGNFLEVPTDCPQRDERLGWTGDAQVFARTACFSFDVRAFFHKWMQDVRDAQAENGAVPNVCPNPNNPFGKPGDGGPAWSDATVICPWTIYLCYGDLEILRAHYASMTRWLDYIVTEQSHDYIRCARETGYSGGFGDWLALEGREVRGDANSKTPKTVVGTAFLAHVSDIMAKVATLLGETGDATKYREQHRRVVDAFRRHFVTETGMVHGNTQTVWILALAFDLLPEALRPVAARELVDNVRRRGTHIGTGFVGTPYILDVLERFGYLDVAYELLEQTDCPSWLFPVTQGATTIWEHWDGWHPDHGFMLPGMNSFNHYAYGAVGAWMVRTLAGLDLSEDAPGYRHIIFRPRPGGTLRHAEARLESPHGPVSIRWELRDADVLAVTLTVPDAATATFDPPAGWEGATEELAAGTHERYLARRVPEPSA
ncbi:MAG: family 78 glycoside hydrolase catalytic domain [Opitutales bacterium]